MSSREEIASLGPKSLPLDGISVVHLGDTAPGQLLAKLLGDQGATIVHFELAGKADAVVPTQRRDVGRLDLDTPEGRAEILRAAKGADIVVDGLFGGGLSAAGIGFDDLSIDNRDLLFCRLAAFPSEAGRDDDEFIEWLIAGELGLHRTKGVAELETITLVSAYGAAQAALYLAAGLVQRERTGNGSEIDVSMFGGGILLFGLELGQVASPHLRNRPTDHRLPIIHIWECADGRYLQSQGDSPPPLGAAMRAMGHPEWTESAIAALIRLEGKEEESAWEERLAEIFRTRTALEWEEAFAAAGAAGTLCRSREEWMAERHANDAGIFVRDDSGRTVVGPAVRVFSPAGETAFKPYPARAEDERLPLAGIRVVDLTTVLAGPTASRMLGELGADVVKIDAPYRMGPPWTHPYGWLEPNRTKRTMLLDLRTDEGKEIAWQLIEQADIVTENYRAGKIASFGFDFESVAKRNPSVVYVSMNVYDYGGAFSERPGWESNGQAVSGMQVFQEKDGRPRQLRPPTNDLATGVLGAYGALVGLYAARRTGRAQRVFGSLSRTATYIQTLGFGDPGGPDPKSVAEILPTRDGAVVVEAGRLDRGQLEALVAGQGSERAVEVLRSRGLIAGIARTPADLLSLGWAREAGLVATWEHPHWGEMTNVFTRGRASNFEHRHGWPAKNPGEDTRAVLEELGFAREEIDSLIERGIAAGEFSLFPKDCILG